MIYIYFEMVILAVNHMAVSVDAKEKPSLMASVMTVEMEQKGWS